MSPLYESDVENFAIALLQKQGYAYLSPEEQETERQNLSDVVLRGRLAAAVDNLNPKFPDGVKEQAIREVLTLSGQSLTESNVAFYKMLVEGVAEEYQKNGETDGAKAGPLTVGWSRFMTWKTVDGKMEGPATTPQADGG